MLVLLLCYLFLVFFIGRTFWASIGSETDGNGSIVFVLLFQKPWILTEDLESTCPIFLFFIVSCNAFVTYDLFWMKWLILHAREPVMLDQNIWLACEKKALSLGQKLVKHFFKILHAMYEPLQLKAMTAQPKMMKILCSGKSSILF